MSFVLFILGTLIALPGSHYLIYRTTTKFFGVTNKAAKICLLSSLLVLSMGFLLSALLVALHRNVLTEAFLWLAWFWIGLWIYLIPVLVVIWLVFFVGRVVGKKPRMKVVCGIGYAAVLIVSFYGVLNAFDVRVRHVDVELRNLPEGWRGKTIVHLSDLHLGSMHKPGFLRRIVADVNALEPELILITGDLFDGMGGNLDSFAESLNAFETSDGVFFVTGNHEGYLGLDAPLAALERTQIRVLDNEVVDLDGLQIVGVAFPEHFLSDNGQALIRLASAIDPDKPSILLFHTPTDVAQTSGDRPDQQTQTYFAPNLGFSFAVEHGIDLQLSGHTHEGQIFPFTNLTRRIFDGYHYGLHQIGGFSIYITSGTGTWGPPMRIGSKSEIVALLLH